jgi:tRNA A-37 threonylcarbamoyl transferase component Bud32
MTRTTPWWVLALGVSFFAYFGLLVYCDLLRSEDWGFEADYRANRMVLTRIVPGSPADRAGLQPHDIVATADGKTIRGILDWTVVDSNVMFDRPIALSLLRNGQPVAASIVLRQGSWSFLRTGPGLFILATLGVQAVALILALVIVLKRPDDAVARVGAWLLATIGVFKIVLPGRIAAVWRDLPAAVSALFWLPHVSDVAAAAVFFTFFASFPRKIFRSAGDWLVLWLPMAIALVRPLQFAFQMVYAPEKATGRAYQGQVLTAVTAFYIIAALTALTANYRRLTDVNERRRVKILLVGALVGLVPGFLVVASYWMRSSANMTQSIFASKATALGTLTLLFFPISFAYAILRHRLLDISVMIRQGVRYALARHVLASLVPAMALLLTADVLLHSDQPLSTFLRGRGWAYLAVGMLALVARAGQRQWLVSLDRHFFREHYNAQQILRQVSDDIRRVGDFERVAPRVVALIETALHPEFVALLLRQPHEVSYRVLVAVPAGLSPPPLRVDSTLLALLRVLGKPLEVSAGGAESLAQQLPPDEVRFLEESGIELLVPIVTNPDRAESVLVLGVKRSEEPYTRQDSDLLAVIAGNLALLLEGPASASVPSTGTFDECPDCGSCYDSGTACCAREGSPLVPVRLSRVLAARYLLDRRLGHGGFGTVYAAMDTALDRHVAVKVIRDDLLMNDDVARRFQHEARMAAAFVHPNVVTVHDFGVAAGRAFLVMELLTGTTLRDALQRSGMFSATYTIRIMQHVCAAVDAAHRRQLVHRDLKPENIFLTHSEADDVAKVLDFGIAKVLHGDSERLARDTTGTGAGIVVGTLRYMAPEQLRGEDVQPAADLWALAVIAHEMLTGTHPFASHGAASVPEDRLGSIAPIAGAAAERFFARALAIVPDQRPTSAAVFLSELERALAV